MLVYRIYNTRLKHFIGGPYQCRKRAKARAEKLNLEYGALSFTVHDSVS